MKNLDRAPKNLPAGRLRNIAALAAKLMAVERSVHEPRQAHGLEQTRMAQARRPTHPGEMLRKDFLVDSGLTVAGLAEAIGVSRRP